MGGGEKSTLLQNLHHLALPVFVLAMSQVPGLSRWARNSLLDVLKADYIRVARAKGLKERTVIVGHGFRNALLPLVTVVTLGIPGLFNGTLLIEGLYAWPGIGGLYIASVQRRDYPVILAISFILSLLVLLSNLLADVAYGIVDPRIHYD